MKLAKKNVFIEICSCLNFSTNLKVSPTNFLNSLLKFLLTEDWSVAFRSESASSYSVHRCPT